MAIKPLPPEKLCDRCNPNQFAFETTAELEDLEGLTNQQIAETLIISPGTAKWYTSQIYSKLGVRNRTRAVARARELEIIQ